MTTRRNFLNIIAHSAGLIALPASALAAQASRRLIQHCPLAGFQHHDGEELWSYLTVGDNLQLRREPTNPHDANAIRVDWNGRKLGYLPKGQNQITANLIDRGRHLEARVGRLERHSNPWHRVAVEVWRVGGRTRKNQGAKNAGDARGTNGWACAHAVQSDVLKSASFNHFPVRQKQ